MVCLLEILEDACLPMITEDRPYRVPPSCVLPHQASVDLTRANITAGTKPPRAVSEELNVQEPLPPPGKRPEMWHTHVLEMASEDDLDDDW